MNSNNSMPICLPPPSAAEACNSSGPIPRLIFEMWGLQPKRTHLGSTNNTHGTGGVCLATVDIDLPDPTGFEVVAGALAKSRMQNTKIIFFSGGPGNGRVAIARQFPGSVFVPKPFEMQELLPLIQRLLRMK
jgi:DNA-binding response OmpR family regulator